MEEIWRARVETILPRVMREQKIDLWIVRSDEGELFFNDESPVFMSLLQANDEGMAIPSRHAPSGSQRLPRFLAFHDTGDEIEYTEPKDYEEIAELVQKLDPERIAIADFANDPLMKALGAKYGQRTVSSWELGVRWLETATPDQIRTYIQVQRVANALIAEGFSNAVVTPGVTTTADLNWWFRHRMLELQLEHENHPTIGVQRKPENIEKYDDPPEAFVHGRSGNDVSVTIQPGDVISCDTDVMLFGLVTDSHQHAYVLEEGETEVPTALQEALLTVNRVQDLLAEEFQQDRTGIEIVAVAEPRMAAVADVVETEAAFHPPPTYIRRFLRGGFFFPTKPWVAGMTSGPGYYPTSIVTNERPLHYDTLYAFEPHTSVAVPGWGERGVELGIGQITSYTRDGFRYLERAQPIKFHVIK